MVLQYNPLLTAVFQNGVPVSKNEVSQLFGQVREFVNGLEVGLQDVGVWTLSAVGGSASAFTGTLPFTPDADTVVLLVPPVENSGPLTLTVNGGPVRSIRRTDTTNLQAGDLKQGQPVMLRLSAAGDWRVVASGLLWSVVMSVIRAAGVHNIGSVSGTGDAITGALPFAEVPGETVAIIIPPATNSGPVTLKLGSGPVRSIMANDSTNLSAGDLRAGQGALIRLSAAGVWRVVGVLRSEIADAIAGEAAAREAADNAIRAAVRSAGVHNVANVAGTGAAMTGTLPFNEVPGETVAILVPPVDNTGPVTLKLGANPVRSVMANDSTNLQAGDLKRGQPVMVRLSAAGVWRVVGVLRSEIADAIAGEAAARTAGDESLRAKLGADIVRLDEQIADPLRRASLLPTHRPGDTPWMHSSGIAGGDPYALVPLTNVTVTGEGAVARIDGSGVISDRHLRAMEPDRQYGVRFALRRAVNSPDPAGDSVRLAIAWYDRFGSLSGTTALENLSPLTTAMGRQSRFFIVSRLPGDDVVAAPAGAVYGRPFIQTYGAGGQTDVEVIDWEDVTGNEVWSPDVGDIQGRVVALESLDVGARLGALEVEAGTTANLRFASEADATAASISASVDTLEIVGVGALRRSQDGYLQTADGSKWEAFGSVRKSQFSATRAPSPSDDETQGYAVGSRWTHGGQEWRADGVDPNNARWSPVQGGVAREAFGTLSAAAAAAPGKTVRIDYDDQALPADFRGVLLEYTAQAAARNINQSGFLPDQALRTFRAQHPSVHPDAKWSTVNIETQAWGSGKNGPHSADYGLTINAAKRGYASGSAMSGEVDGLTIYLRNDGPDGFPSQDPGSSDAAAIMVNAYNAGTCGFVSVMDATAGNILREAPYPTEMSMQVQAGVIDANNAAGKIGFGFVAAMKVGVGRSAFHVGASPGSDWENYFDSPKFRIRGTGDLRWRDGAYPDYAAQIARTGGLDGLLSILNRGNGGISIAAGGAGGITFATSNVGRVQITVSGTFQPVTDQGVNLGADTRRFGAGHLQALYVYGNNIRLPGLPTADPADGNSRLWMDPATRNLRIGT